MILFTLGGDPWPVTGPTDVWRFAKPTVLGRTGQFVRNIRRGARRQQDGCLDGLQSQRCENYYVTKTLFRPSFVSNEWETTPESLYIIEDGRVSGALPVLDMLDTAQFSPLCDYSWPDYLSTCSSTHEHMNAWTLIRKNKTAAALTEEAAEDKETGRVFVRVIPTVYGRGKW